MNKTICNKCGCEIHCGIRTDSNEVFPKHFTIDVSGFTGEGRLMSNMSKKVHLCENCYSEFETFLDSKSVTGKQYVVHKAETKTDSTFAVGCGNFTTNDLKPSSIQVGLGFKDIKSEMKCGNIYFYTSKIFNKLQRKMWQKFFGVDINDYRG